MRDLYEKVTGRPRKSRFSEASNDSLHAQHERVKKLVDLEKNHRITFSTLHREIDALRKSAVRAINNRKQAAEEKRKADICGTELSADEVAQLDPAAQEFAKLDFVDRNLIHNLMFRYRKMVFQEVRRLENGRDGDSEMEKSNQHARGPAISVDDSRRDTSENNSTAATTLGASAENQSETSALDAAKISKMTELDVLRYCECTQRERVHRMLELENLRAITYARGREQIDVLEKIRGTLQKYEMAQEQWPTCQEPEDEFERICSLYPDLVKRVGDEFAAIFREATNEGGGEYE
jgi:hypothetical protein